MTQSHRKSIEQLLKLSPREWLAYLKILPEAERRATSKELVKAVSNRTMETMLDNLNSQARPLQE